ncbi:MAG TPA: glycosyltransferase family 39 protein [Polyangia bacterium]|nr:glycosyltransferase family 39 protein [Polyangia bacterium]
MSWRARAAIFVAMIAIATPLLLVGTGGQAIHEGDEAIYAEMAREMADSGRVGELTWQGQPQFPRPPMTVWILAGARKIFSWPDERAVRWPLALFAALEVALVFLLGAALWRPQLGVVAAGALLASDLFVGYARYLESEPFLCVFVVGAFVCWEAARTRPRLIYGWGALLGCALMTKQLVGALPLLAPIVDRLARDEGRIPARLVWRGAIAAAVVALPWHVYATAKFGRAFLDSYLLRNVLERSTAVLLHQTRATFYLRELWRSEGALVILAAAAIGCALIGAIRKRARADLLIASWALGVLAIFSAARSRYDHYLLLAYPAMALAIGAACGKLPLRPSVRAVVAAAYLGTAALAHWPRNLAGFSGEAELRDLARVASQRYHAPARLYTYNLHGYAARYYATLDVTTLLESAEDFRLAQELQRAGMPCPVEPAPELAAALAQRPRPFALLMPRARAELVRGVALTPLAATPHYLLYGAD